MPPVGLVSIEPLSVIQLLLFVSIVEQLSVLGSVSVSSQVEVHPLASFTVIVCMPAARPVKEVPD